ncbi:hypothetical protein H7K34_03625 [Mycobacterium montefiorense]|nr:hypothetical protein [Mycobacterium montefiorense]
MSWFGRAKEASVGQRVTRSDKQQAIDTIAELNALNAERERLMREGLPGVATIVAIHENVAATPLGCWHELELEVQLPDQDPYRARRRVSLQLSASPHIAVGAQVPVRVDRGDLSKVLVVATP